VEDAADILALQKLAYRSEAEIYGDDTIPPLTQTLEEMCADLKDQVVLKASIDERIVGSVRAYEEQGTCFVGRLIVHPDFQNRGIGTRLMREIERAFTQAERFELFTGDRSERNLHLYLKLGYSVFKRQELTERVTLVFMEKHGNLDSCITTNTPH
jgi:ribosomal protein S18 acetylase RimI-like enzyme